MPHDWTDKNSRKMQASEEVWGDSFDTTDTRHKFEAHRLELAKPEWARLSVRARSESIRSS